MGIPVGSKTVDLELRYSAVSITKNLNSGEVSITIPYQIGFFDDNGTWVTESADYITATGDAAMILFGVTPAMIGGTDTTPIGQLINQLAYAIVSKQIKVTASIVIDSVVSSDEEVPAPELVTVKVLKEDALITTFSLTPGTEESPEFPALLGATLVIEAEGFEPVSVQVAVLQGTYHISSVTMTPRESTDTNSEE